MDSKMLYRFSTVLLSTALVTGCLPQDDAQALLDQNKQSWQDSNVKGYGFDYQRTGFEVGEDMHVYVKGGQVLQITNLGPDLPRYPMLVSNAPTVDNLYENIETCFESETCEVNALTFNDKYVPTKYSYSNFEEGGGFNLSNFMEDGLSTCLGFKPPSVVVSVENKLTGNVINDATVTAQANNQAFVLDLTEDNVYQSYFHTIDSAEISLDLTVSHMSYEPETVADLSLLVSTSCMAENTIKLTVQLCPVGEKC